MMDRIMGPSRRETDCGSVLEQDVLTNSLGFKLELDILNTDWLGLVIEKRRSDRLPEFRCRIRRSGRLY